MQRSVMAAKSCDARVFCALHKRRYGRCTLTLMNDERPMTKPTGTRGSFKFIDHTADVGILVTAPALEEVFETSAFALTELITSVDSISCRTQRRFRLQEDEIETLLVSWLQELLYVLDAEGYIFGRFQVNLHDLILEATAWGEPFDPNIHSMKTEIKAVTYHLLEVVKSDRGWQARVIFDI